MRGWKPWIWSRWNASRISVIPSCQEYALALAREKHDHPNGTSSPSLKGELRRLYKLIHPDLLQNQPVQQAANQKSFQLLQEYLTAARGGEGADRFVYHFEFYIPGKGNDGPLEKVEVSLPPPQRWSYGRQEHELRPSTRKSMGKLFEACGLSINFSEIDEKPSLRTLFQEASELQRKAEASQLSWQQQLSLISNALSIGRGVKVLFRSSGLDANAGGQVELMERMAKALDGSTGINFSGSTFVIGNGYKVDYLGRLWLNYLDDVELWIQFMKQADLVTASIRRVAAKSRQAEEEKVARLLGVELVFADDALALHPDYSRFLRSIVNKAVEQGTVGGGRFLELPVRVGEVEVPLVDEAIGCVIVPVTEKANNLYRFIEQNGDKALEYRRSFIRTERKLEDLRNHVRLKLRLRHLTFDRKVTPDQLMSACTRLSNHAGRLSTYTEGLSLCISDEYRMPSEEFGHDVHMKWNFSLDSL